MVSADSPGPFCKALGTVFKYILGAGILTYIACTIWSIVSCAQNSINPLTKSAKDNSTQAEQLASFLQINILIWLCIIGFVLLVVIVVSCFKIDEWSIERAERKAQSVASLT